MDVYVHTIYIYARPWHRRSHRERFSTPALPLSSPFLLISSSRLPPLFSHLGPVSSCCFFHLVFFRRSLLFFLFLFFFASPFLVTSFHRVPPLYGAHNAFHSRTLLDAARPDTSSLIFPALAVLLFSFFFFSSVFHTFRSSLLRMFLARTLIKLGCSRNSDTSVLPRL